MNIFRKLDVGQLLGLQKAGRSSAIEMDEIFIAWPALYVYWEEGMHGANRGESSGEDSAF